MEPAARVSLFDLNAASPAAFVAALEGVWEHSPWIVEAAAGLRPFATTEALIGAMNQIVVLASPDQQVALLRAHPDLAGKLARSGDLTAESANEQASAGLDRLSEEEFAQFSRWNTAYRELFGFPFIICVRENTKSSIRNAFERRLANDPAEERRTALAEVQKIAAYRLRDRVRT